MDVPDHQRRWMSRRDGGPTLTAESAVELLAELSADLGLNCTGAHVLGPVGDNAVLRLPVDGVVARMTDVPSGLTRFGREVAIAEWLAGRGFPAVRVAADVDQPVVRGSIVATFWEEVPEPVPASSSEIGSLLRRLHALPDPPYGLLDRHDPFASQKEHIEAAAISSEGRTFLFDLLTELQEACSALPYLLADGVVHGDAHRKNVVRAADGRVLLLDLERFGLGHREWDVIVPAVYRRVGWYSPKEYEAFVHAYGFDITLWEGYPTLATARELRMTTWLAARTGREPRLIPEVQNRIASLRDPSGSRTWVPGT